MRILADSNITLATISATNVLSDISSNRLKTWPLDDNMRTIANSSVIDLTFDTTIPDVDCIALCGTNLTPSSVITISYADVDITSPDYSETITTFSTLNQVLFLSASVNKKYWRISATDTTLSTFFVGFVYIGTCYQVEEVQYGHTPSLDIYSNVSITPTGQQYGGKGYNAFPVDFTLLLSYNKLVAYLDILQEKQNVDRVLMVEYEDSYDLTLYRPKYGVLATTETPYPMAEDPLTFVVSGRFEERF